MVLIYGSCRRDGRSRSTTTWRVRSTSYIMGYVIYKKIQPSKDLREDLLKIARATKKLIQIVEGASEDAIFLLYRYMSGRDLFSDGARAIILDGIPDISRCAEGAARSLGVSRRRHTGAILLAEELAVSGLSVVWFRIYGKVAEGHREDKTLPIGKEAREANKAGRFVIDASRAVGLVDAQDAEQSSRALSAGHLASRAERHIK